RELASRSDIGSGRGSDEDRRGRARPSREGAPERRHGGQGPQGVIPAPTGAITLGDGRWLSYDDVGDLSGAPVVYLHGCPDCRLTRHPDDGAAARAGVRLIAVDRPGYGSSDEDEGADENALALDVIALADALGIERFAVFGWSAGGPGALALAAGHPD